MNNCILVDLLREKVPGKIMVDLNNYIRDCYDGKHAPCTMSKKELSDLIQSPKELWGIIDAIYDKSLTPEDFKRKYDLQPQKRKTFMTEFFKTQLENITGIPFEPFEAKENIITLYSLTKGYIYKEEKVGNLFKITIRLESNSEISFHVLPEKEEIDAYTVIRLINAAVASWKTYKEITNCKPFCIQLEE